MHRHRAGSMHQSNKPFKSRHASKGTLKEKSKGKVNRAPIKQSGLKTQSKTDRRHAAKMLQQKKRDEVTRMHRIFEGRTGAPKIVPILNLCPDSDSDRAIAGLYQTLDLTPPADPSVPNVLHAERFKQKLQLFPLRRNFLDVMDAFKVADYAILLLSADVEVDSFGINCLLGILNQGLVNVVPVVQHLSNVPAKNHVSVKKSLLAFVQQFFPEQQHLYSLDTPSDAMNVLRFLTSQRPKPLVWRDLRPYMLADEVTFEPENEETGLLKVTGYARGNPFNANRLVHLQNYGDFQIQQITSADLGHDSNNAMEQDTQVLDTPLPGEQDDLIAENEPDFMENEQTWPTEEELAEADERVRRMQQDQASTKKRVPKGTSAYQAAWIVDEEDDDFYSDEDEDEDQAMTVDQEDYEDDIIEPAGAMNGDVGDEEYEEIEMEKADNQEEDELDLEEEQRQYEEYLKNRKEEFDGHNEFPDEIDTPMHMQARQRFARYRGLQSFRTSPWDPYENLPVDYSRIFQFENFTRTKSRIVSQAVVGKVKPGRRITLWIQHVPKGAYDMFDARRPYVVFGLLQYEHKTSLLNLQITRDNAYEEPVRSKDPMILHLGYRRYRVQPIYSQNSNKGSNNVHKFDRFLPMGRSSIATVYGPVVFGKVPCMLYKESNDINEPILVSTGTFVNTDVKRIVAKRIILSGHPYRIHKRSAVIRYMFFNSEDIEWFKPVQLTTKYGRVGHIRDSVGTHGYMRCTFDGPMTQQDTVMLSLYKRVFPKWNTELYQGGLIKDAQPVPLVNKPMDMDVE
ncbi:DUF663-domain-containing protein [Hesseltinella vesiculosa]|uniref:DUF663-domain-containing protein n=1 Tax=Hesseltinella vesiculosa TaxID=101127 RepID=A0A1X2GP08_9FUNG|nr:DUF663-domain-containing protein [Hesseltinella vesiculosa]